jgi:L-2-hydroxyglutarate oxidase LhgO
MSLSESALTWAERQVPNRGSRKEKTGQRAVLSADVIVVGAGILGLAVAREVLLREPDATLTVLEKEDHIAGHQTGHNSGVVHSGIYYAPGSLKARLCVEGSRLLYSYCDEQGIPYERCGKVIVATIDEELEPLDKLHRNGLANGVTLQAIGPRELRELEPHVAGLRGLHSPETSIIDFRRVAAALACEVTALGGAIRTVEQVTDIAERASGAIVKTQRRIHEARYVVTCAGLHSDRLAAMTGAPASPKIVPFRGSYYVLRAQARRLVNGLVYPVPDPAFPFLGVHFTKQISGEVWVGPNAILALAREGYRRRDVDVRDVRDILAYGGFRALARRHWRVGLHEIHGEVSKRAFVRALRRLVPALRIDDVAGRRAGVRAQALAENGILVDDFWLDRSARVTHVRNAPSPAATSSLALARSIVDEIEPDLASP